MSKNHNTKLIVVIIIAFILSNLNFVSAQKIAPKFSVPGIKSAEFNKLLNVTVKEVFLQPISTYNTVSINLYKKYKYSELVDVIENISQSEMVKTFEIGKSADNRKIYSMEIGTGKTIKMLCAGTHARENANPIFLLKYIANLVNDFHQNKEYAKKILSNTTYEIMPCVNPDGYVVTQFGKKALNNKKLFINKYTDEELKRLKANANGVDINRNFPTYLASSYWGGKRGELLSKKPALEFYPGKTLGSEPETKAMMAWIAKYIKKASIYIDLHQSGRVVYYGKPHLSDEYNRLAKGISNSINKSTGYKLLTNINDVIGRDADGTTTDFAAELASGFVYNSTIKRLAPVKSGNVKIYKYKKLNSNVAICTIETMTVSNMEISKRAIEWKNKNLFNMFLHL